MSVPSGETLIFSLSDLVINIIASDEENTEAEIKFKFRVPKLPDAVSETKFRYRLPGALTNLTGNYLELLGQRRRWRARMDVRDLLILLSPTEFLQLLIRI